MAKDLTIVRVFKVPKERVWKAWTDPELIKRWWGAKGFTCPTAVIDLKVGGKYLFCMRSPEGQDIWSTGTYYEVIPGQKLVASDSFADAEGKVVSPTSYGMDPDFPAELVIKIILGEIDGKTEMTLIHTGMPDGNDQEMTKQGWNESFDKLEELLTP